VDVDLIARNRDAFLAAGVGAIVPGCCGLAGSASTSSRPIGSCAATASARAHVRGPSALAALGEGTLRLPVIVKPRFGFASRHLFQANTEEQLRVLFDYAPDMIVQQRMAGQSTALMSSTTSTGGRCRSS
jgi:hypothetical protein